MTEPEGSDELAGLGRCYALARRRARELGRRDEERARARLAASPELRAYAGSLLDWPTDAERWHWLATSPEAELGAWAERRKTYTLEDTERYPRA